MTKRYFWLKLKEDFFNSDDIKIIQGQENGSDYIIFWQKLLLKSISREDIGLLRYKENIPYTPEILATVTDTNIDIVKGALNVFKKLGMIDINKDGDILIDELIHDLIGSEVDSARRVRKHREKQKALHGNKRKQLCNVEIELDKDKEIDIELVNSIYEYWNTLSIINHRKYTSTMKYRVRQTIKTYTQEEIQNAMKNLKEVLTDDKYYWTHEYTLEDFLKRGLEKFLDTAHPLTNFLKDKQTTPRECPKCKIELKQTRDKMICTECLVQY